MKKITIYRNGEAAFLDEYLLRDSTYRIFAHARQLFQKDNKPGLIITSHAPRATRTAQVIQLAMPNIRIVQTPFLSQYYAGSPERFITHFTRMIPGHMRHVLLVSHMINIYELTKCSVVRGGSVTLTAESWSEMFTPAAQRHVNEFPWQDKSSQEIADECHFSFQEREMLSSLPFVKVES